MVVCFCQEGGVTGQHDHGLGGSAKSDLSMCRLVTQSEVLSGLESLGIVTEGTARGDYVNYPVGF